MSFTCEARVVSMLQKNLLKEAREKKGLSQEALANLVGVSRQTIISIERDRYVPSLELALKLAKTFKKKIENLFDI